MPNIFSALISPQRGRITTQPLRFFAVAIYLSVLFTEIIFRVIGLCQFHTDLPLLMTFIVLAVLTIVEWAEQRYFPKEKNPSLHLAIATLVLRMALIYFLEGYSCSGFHRFLDLITPLLAYLYIGPRTAYIVSAINLINALDWFYYVSNGRLVYTFDEDSILDFLIYLAAHVFILVLGRALVLEEQNRKRAEQLLAELEHSQTQLTELAKVEERNRIARDIHDSIGHHLTAINIQLDKAMAFRPINSEEADQALHDAKRSAHNALADVRDSVSALRTSTKPFMLKESLDELVTSFGRVPTTLEFAGDETNWAKLPLLALYRAAQEGLTNIEKHADATSAQLKVSLKQKYATLSLQDNGGGMNVAQFEQAINSEDDHFGLLGLRERLELLGGTLTIRSEQSHGTQLQVHLPIRRSE